jgi:hypothetical protein
MSVVTTALLGLLLGQTPDMQRTNPVASVPLPVIINGTPRSASSSLPGPAKPVKTVPSPETVAETLVTFDPDQLSLTWTDGRWQLQAGPILLKDFGRSETAARRMLLVIRELRLNQLGKVGQPKPVMEYWLSQGQAPTGMVSGLATMPLDQESLRVEKSYGQWWVRDSLRMLLNFDRDEEGAQQAVAILTKYKFTQLGLISNFNPPVLIFLSPPGQNLHLAARSPGQPGRTQSGFGLPTRPQP